MHLFSFVFFLIRLETNIALIALILIINIMSGNITESKFKINIKILRYFLILIVLIFFISLA